MATRHRRPGIDHLTVVPENFDPAKDGDQDEDEDQDTTERAGSPASE